MQHRWILNSLFSLCRHLTLPDIPVGCPRRESKQTPNRDRRRQRTSSQNCTRPRTQAYQRASILSTNVGAGCSCHPTGAHIISGRAFLPILSDSVGWTLTTRCKERWETRRRRSRINEIGAARVPSSYRQMSGELRSRRIVLFLIRSERHFNPYCTDCES